MFFKLPTAQAVVQTQLADAERERLTHMALTEYHAAMAGMLNVRIARLRNEKAAPTLTAIVGK